jgi:hypothetical protein
MTNLGFKKLTPENWLEPDKFNFYKVSVSLSSGQTQPIDFDERRRQTLDINLTEKAPLEVRRMFEVARGAVVYGYFFYPLYVLGAEQLFRVAEAAVTFKCEQMGAKTDKMRFIEKIKYLVSVSAVPTQEEDSWQGIREMRNAASHPDMQTMFDSAEALFFLQLIAGKINSLFA